MQRVSLTARSTMVLSMLLALAMVSAQSGPPQALSDGVPSYILPTIQTNYFYFDVCSAGNDATAASAAAPSESSASAPIAASFASSSAPITVAWTNLTNLTPTTPYSSLDPFAADLYISFLVADPSPSNFEFRSRTGMVSVPTPFKGCRMYLSVVVPDVAFVNGTTQYGIVVQQQQEVQLTECVPQRWATQSVDATTPAQFTLQSTATQGSSQTVAFTAASMSTPSEFTLLAGTTQPLTKSSALWQLGPNEQQVLYQNDPHWPSDGVFFLSVVAETTEPFVLITNGNAGWCSTGFRVGDAAEDSKPSAQQRKQVGNDPNNPALLTDGGVFAFPALEPSANGFFYLDLKLHSYLAQRLSMSLPSRPDIPPLVCAFTDLSSSSAAKARPVSSVSAAASPPPSIWGSWGWNAPNNNSFDVSSGSGVLLVDNSTVVGQYQLNLALQWGAGETLTPFSFGCQIFNALQIAAGSPRGQPQNWQSVVVATGGAFALQQFVTSVPSSLGQQQCTLTVLLPIGGDTGFLSLFLSTTPNPSPVQYQWTSNGTAISIADFPAGDQLYIGVETSGQTNEDVVFQLRVDLACSGSGEEEDQRKELGSLVGQIALE